MSDPHFFGYGSLVNTSTHDYPSPRPATLVGWRRAWVRTGRRDVVFLTGVPSPKDRIQGVIAAVPNNDWTALDLRETGYERVVATQNLIVESPPRDTAVYAVPPRDMRQGGNHRILLSYLDVVVQGYLQVFGTQGVSDFFATTDGWDTPILNDRTTPWYPRAQQLSDDETALVDQHINALSTQMQYL